MAYLDLNEYAFFNATGATVQVNQLEINWRGPWSGSSTYTAASFDSASLGSSNYICIVNSSGSYPKNYPAFWSILALTHQATNAISQQVYSGSYANPNGTLVPDDTNAAAVYYQDAANPVQWNWSVSSQDWVLTGSLQTIVGSYANPNGNVTPANPGQGAVYYQDNSNPVAYWAWSVANQNWFPIVS